MFLNTQCYNIIIQLDMFAGVRGGVRCVRIFSNVGIFCRVEIEDVSSVVNPL